ncbi:MAG: NAD/NADP octopine/nopaline dehydrogenase family protein [Salinarimonas sp.]|nr:NAD/NADP octopine/nopaline dehydrogenase family protein [Salinarimonas sp.]
MKIGIAGAGPVGLGTAALAMQAGHVAILFSPNGGEAAGMAAETGLEAAGAVAGLFKPGLAADAADLAARADVLLIAVPGYGHKPVMDALAPHIRDGQPVIVSSQSSFGPLYMGDLLAQRGVSAPIVAWSTTTITARSPAPGRVHVVSLRSRIDMCSLPETETAAMLALCELLFGQRFHLCDGLLAITLSNLNPQNHLGIALCNFTRMERGETWSQNLNVTPGVGRLLEALDAERLAIADALGLTVRTLFEHLNLSYQIPVGATVAEMFAAMEPAGMGHNGPATADSRYVTEDVPFGLVPLELLGTLSGRPAPLHSAGIDSFSAIYGRDFRAENPLLPALGMERMRLEALQEAARRGHLQGG